MRMHHIHVFISPLFYLFTFIPFLPDSCIPLHTYFGATYLEFTASTRFGMILSPSFRFSLAASRPVARCPLASRRAYVSTALSSYDFIFRPVK